MLATGANPKPNFQIANSTWPSTGKGPQTITMNLDFTAGTVINGDLVEEQQAGMIGLIQGIYIDNRLNGQAITFSFSGTNQRLSMDAGQEGILPVLAPGSLRFSVTTTGAVIVPVMFLDAPTPYYTNGPVPIVAPTGGITVNSIVDGPYTTSAKVALTGADQVLLAANAARKDYMIQNPSTNDSVWINYGAAAAVGTAYELTPGGILYPRSNFINNQAIHAFGTAAQNVGVFEG